MEQPEKQEQVEMDQEPTELILSNCPGTTPATPLSKNQLKKQKKLVEYAALRKLRRQKERDQKKLKRQEAKALGLPRIGPSRKELKRRNKQEEEESEGKQSPKFQVAIDLDYDEQMQERDIAKCVKQCLRIYTINRRGAQPGRLHFTGIKTNGQIHKCFQRNDGWENWQVAYHFDSTHLDAFEKDRMIYLTCESDTVLDQLNPECIYVIGGLVDHNHFKGLCHKRATEAGLKTARLPLSEHVDMKTRSVLSTYHVFELLSRVLSGEGWTEAILATIPLRKGAKAKTVGSNESIHEDNAQQTNESEKDETQDESLDEKKEEEESPSTL
ncbi:tRNA methyltransferase 10 homolog A [Drosophila tropicalis]|uniref:tRNA methyltransferase 10 homolog A n=1 Tax=Drosophila tropicalis TaxID=46794 RepID=UPI0035AC256D